MRDLIVRALAWALALLTPQNHQSEPGRHSAAYLSERPQTTLTRVSADPWRSPWRGPSAAEARAIFRAEETVTLDPVRRERFFATAWAERGYDYTYVAPGVHQVPAVSAA